METEKINGSRPNSRPARLRPTVTETIEPASRKDFNGSITNHPDLALINWTLTGHSAPGLPTTAAGELPAADAIVITWTEAEWAAMEHVFCSSAAPMTYGKRNTGSWPGWQQYQQSLPAKSVDGWTYWGYFRLVLLGTKRVLLFKSNTHLDFPGATYLTQLIGRFITVVKPSLILSIGTAGGAMPSNHLGTINVVHAGTMYVSGEPATQWKTYTNTWQAGWELIQQTGFQQLLMPVPTTATDLQSLVAQFNTFYGTSYSESDLNINNLNMGDKTPLLQDMTGTDTSLLTTDSFVVGTSSGNLGAYSCVEMDDTLIAQACQATKTPFGFVRNISDPVQNAALPATVQANWGSAIYEAYGLYTSVNGALTAWGILSS